MLFTKGKQQQLDSAEIEPSWGLAAVHNHVERVKGLCAKINSPFRNRKELPKTLCYSTPDGSVLCPL